VTALRSRILARFTELEEERAKIGAQLAELAKDTTGPGEPALLDALPMLGDILTEAPARLLTELFQAFDLQLLYKKEMDQVSIRATVTPATPNALAAMIKDSETPDAPVSVTTSPGFSDLSRHPLGVGLRGQRVADLGTGTGTLARDFAAAGCAVTGVDVAPKMLDEARLADAAAGLAIDYHLAPAEETRLPGHVWDVVCAGQCWHWFNPGWAMRGCKPGAWNTPAWPAFETAIAVRPHSGLSADA
jgi:SAM-dependent methyltransferase